MDKADTAPRLNGDRIAAGEPPALLGVPMRPLPAHNWSWFALRGVLSILLGVAVLAMPGLALYLFAMLFAAFSLVDGVLSVISGVRGARAHEDRWWALVLAGLLGIAIGVAFFLFPLLGTVAYAATAVLLIGGWAVLTGVLEIAAAWRMRREIEGEWLLILAGALSVLFGVIVLALLVTAPAVTLLTLAWMIGFYALAAGVVLLILAFRLKRHGGQRDPSSG